MEPAFFVMKYQDYGSVYHREDCRLRDQMPVFFAVIGTMLSVAGKPLLEKHCARKKMTVGAAVFLRKCTFLFVEKYDRKCLNKH